jgi:hypothetical protein
MCGETARTSDRAVKKISASCPRQQLKFPKRLRGGPRSAAQEEEQMMKDIEEVENLFFEVLERLENAERSLIHEYSQDRRVDEARLSRELNRLRKKFSAELDKLR